MKDKKSVGFTNRNKGFAAERLYAKLFRELGLTDCITSRYGSRIHDDAGIDLINLPFNTQIKAGKQKGMNPSNILNYMKERVKKLFPDKAPENNMINIVIHKKEVGKGKKRNEYDEIVHLSFKDFSKLIKKTIWE